MLSCIVDGIYTEASASLDRNLDFKCPECDRPLVLKAGARNIPHFSHRSIDTCHHGEGETLWHRKGKRRMADLARELGFDVLLEHKIGARRTDVFLTKGSKTIAVEFQQKDEGMGIYSRTRDLAKNAGMVMWVLPWQVKEVHGRYRATATYAINALYSDSKAPNNSEVRFYDEIEDRLHACEKRPWHLYVEETDFGGGYYKTSKRWCELVILKSYPPSP